MTEKPCDTCTKECVGGIIYGNCKQFLHWRNELVHLSVCLDSLLQSSRPTGIAE
ncbi:MAG: hypothetical protein NT092_14695 [Bacteroidia bacterium]|nr:hypothetical protein [Bacteroidia bacterium]